jgi:hypothetical protein
MTRGGRRARSARRALESVEAREQVVVHGLMITVER